MTIEFYGSDPASIRTINRILHLPSTGSEQDWEFEFADVNRIDDIVSAFEIDMNVNERRALALLLLSSLEQAEDIDEHKLLKIKLIIEADSYVLQSMKYYWIDQGIATNDGLVRRILRG